MDLMYKNINNVAMLNDTLVNVLNIDNRLVYAIISNFEGTKYIYELMKPKGSAREDLNNNINSLLGFTFIEDVGDNIDL